jgi:hypothetical protein
VLEELLVQGRFDDRSVRGTQETRLDDDFISF